MENFSFCVIKMSRSMAGNVSEYLTAIQALRDISFRLRNVRIENLDFRELFRLYDSPSTLFYCDPPYLPDVRSHNCYKYDMTSKDHEDFLDIVSSLKGMVIISGYESELYDKVLTNWYKISFDDCVRLNVSKRGEIKNKRTEVVWISPNACSNGQFYMFLQ